MFLYLALSAVYPHRHKAGKAFNNNTKTDNKWWLTKTLIILGCILQWFEQIKFGHFNAVSLTRWEEKWNLFNINVVKVNASDIWGGFYDLHVAVSVYIEVKVKQSSPKKHLFLEMFREE